MRIQEAIATATHGREVSSELLEDAFRDGLVADYAAVADTVMVSLSKGLGAPVGSMLAGDAEVLEPQPLLRSAYRSRADQAAVLILDRQRVRWIEFAKDVPAIDLADPEALESHAAREHAVALDVIAHQPAQGHDTVHGL